jgi:hypothetical protein
MPAHTIGCPQPPAPIPDAHPAPLAVTGAIQQAARSTGHSFEYLLATAKVESDLDPALTVRTSTGPGETQSSGREWSRPPRNRSSRVLRLCVKCAS